jgi:hypothetical protein
MCFVRISEQTATFALLNINGLVFITEVESVYSAVRTESLYKTDALRRERVNIKNSTWCPHCVYVFCTDLRANSNICLLKHYEIGFYNRSGECLQRGTH